MFAAILCEERASSQLTLLSVLFLYRHLLQKDLHLHPSRLVDHPPMIDRRSDIWIHPSYPAVESE